MRLGRLRSGELTALAGSIGLLVVMFLDWFDVTAGVPTAGLHQTGWTSLGWFVDVMIAISIAGGLALAYVTVTRTSPGWPVGAGVITTAWSALTFLVLLIRVLTQPGLGADLPNAAVTIQWPAYAGLLFCALITTGAWLTLRDERTDAPESAYTPPPARPVPGT